MENLKIFTENIEQVAMKQLEALLEQEAFKDCKIRIMPDVHAGKGCVIGFTADLGEKVIPNIVGVDIGCGMLCINLGKEDLDLRKLDNTVNEHIPSGMNIRKEKQLEFEKIQNLHCLGNLKETGRFNKAIGTLGGGNHFIEIDVDDENNKYLVIHTGSRNLGSQVAEYYQNLAIELACGKEEYLKQRQEVVIEYKKQGRQGEIQDALKQLRQNFEETEPKLPKELCYLEGEYRTAYLDDMKICQEYASINRLQIAKNILINYYNLPYEDGEYPKVMENRFETIHNYISFEDNIVRKGAISAKKGERVIIPINMKDGSIIAIGKGNDDWNNSAPHGAGRLMSRHKAREMFNLKDFEKEMQGIYSTSVVQETIDEAPFAYKSMQEIIDHIQDTVEIEKIIKPIYNFKAKG